MNHQDQSISMKYIRSFLAAAVLLLAAYAGFQVNSSQVSFVSPASAANEGYSPPDPFILTEIAGTPGYNNNNGLSIRSTAIDPAKKTLVLIVAGQSNWTSINPTLYTPTSSSVIDNANIYDGALYSIGGPLLGAQYTPTNGSLYGPGNPAARLAQLFITNAIFDRVILVPIAIGNTSVAQWSTGGTLFMRPAVAMRRLASRGITPATTGATFAFLWGQGESDTQLGTLTAAYTASFTPILTLLVAAGFSGRTFVCKETWWTGSVSAQVQAAQTGLVNGTTIFSGGDLDTLNATNRQSDNTHFNDTGAAAAALLVYNAMHASGAPF